MASQCLQTAHACIEAYNAHDIERILALRTPDCVHHIMPSSLKRQTMSNEEYKASFAPLMKMLEGFTLSVHDVVEDTSASKIAMRASSKARSVVGEYENEYMLIMHMTSDGKKIRELFEFVDSLSSSEYFAKLRQHMGQATNNA